MAKEPSTKKKTTVSKKEKVAKEPKEPKQESPKVEVPRPFTKPISEMPFEELITLEGVLLQEINWLGEQCLNFREQASSLYQTSTGRKVAGYESIKEAEFAINAKHNKLVALCTQVHNRITNYIIDKWTS